MSSRLGGGRGFLAGALLLNAHVERQLGDSFDLRAFHQVVLGEGAIPLDVLQSQVEAWLAAPSKLRSAASKGPS